MDMKLKKKNTTVSAYSLQQGVYFVKLVTKKGGVAVDQVLIAR